jgi:DNA-binding transcriptional regulator YhcF (GntR family)
MSTRPEPTFVPDSKRIQLRALTLGQEALEGRRDLGDILGSAFQELKAAVGTIHAMQAELEKRDRALVALGAALEAERSRGRDAARAPEPARPAPVQARIPLRVPVAQTPASPRVPSAQAPVGAVPAPAPREPVDLLAGPVPEGSEALETSMRARIAAAKYLGTLGAGDRLPSIRDVARWTGLNHKTIRRVYQSLERAGLVEVRDRSGIYVAETPSPLNGGGDEMEEWVGRLLVEAADRGLRAGELPRLLLRWSASRPLRCACVESAEDDRVALAREVRDRFGLEAVPVSVRTRDLAAAIADADLVVTTPFHAEEVRSALAPDQPLVVADLHAGVREALQTEVGEGEAVILCVDSVSGRRLLQALDPGPAPRARVVALDDRSGNGQPLPEVRIATLAAWERLGGAGVPGPVLAPPLLSPRAALEIARLLVRLNRALAPR